MSKMSKEALKELASSASPTDLSNLTLNELQLVNLYTTSDMVQVNQAITLFSEQGLPSWNMPVLDGLKTEAANAALRLESELKRAHETMRQYNSAMRRISDHMRNLL